jgi:hypothetical protein
MKVLEGVNKGDRVLVSGPSGGLVAIGRCVGLTKTLVRLQGPMIGGDYLISTGKKRGDDQVSARPATPEELAAAEKELERRQAEKEEQERLARQAAYDALPEGIKLARAIEWWVNSNGEKKLAEAPLELLRGLAKWMEGRP